LNLSQPPFAIIPRQSAAAAVDMVEVFAAIDPLPDKVSQSFDAVAQCPSVNESTPPLAAGRRLAQAIDRGEGTGRVNFYHNAQHFCEVLLCAHFLSLWTDLAADARLEIVLAALMHDFHHDGYPNGPIPFRLERQAIHQATPFLLEAGIPEKQQRRLSALILATEIVHGLPIVRACYTHHIANAPLPALPVAAPEMTALAQYSIATQQTLILCEADVLPSVGLTIEHAICLQDKLSLESSVPLQKEDKLRFISEIFPGFVIGVFFQPNVERLYQFLRSRPNDVSTS